MKNRFEAIAHRRAALVEEIGFARQGVTLVARSLRKELAWAGTGLVVSHLIGRKRWLRIVSLGALAVSLVAPLLAHFLPARR